ncbi:MAG: AN1-type zinc finger domain-containing protein, partial [Candidatus Heimdallarchaeota archaeon]
MTECAFPSCENKEYLPFKCNYCEKSFCRTHRLPENHNCKYIHLGKLPSRQPASEKPAAEVTTEKPSKPKKSSKPKLKKTRQKKERKSRKQRREEKPIQAEYYEPTDDHY